MKVEYKRECKLIEWLLAIAFSWLRHKLPWQRGINEMECCKVQVTLYGGGGQESIN